jgi:glycine cleavage system transcriptional repressor
VQQIIVNAIGPDRPGIVGQFTGHLHAAGANVLDSRMVNLRGQFAIILLVEASPDGVTRIRETLPPQAEKLGLRVTLTEPAAAVPAPPVKGIPFKLKTYSLDQPGIVHRVSDLLREFGVNIEELTAHQQSAPFAGEPLFLMEMRLTVPPGVSIQTLRGKLQTLCDSLNCDVDFEPA